MCLHYYGNNDKETARKHSCASRPGAHRASSEGVPLLGSFRRGVVCQRGSAHSLRENCGCLATALGKLVHFGMQRTPTRSPLAFANAYRPWQVDEPHFYQVPALCQAVAALKRRRLRFTHPLRNLDTTLLELCAAVFDWAWFVRTQGDPSHSHQESACRTR